jgi:hypothetical protein
MVSLMATSDVDNGLDPSSGQAKNDEPGISCCSAKYAVALGSKNKDLLL